MSDNQALAARIDALNDAMAGMRSVLEKVADAVVRLAVLEEKHANATSMIRRLHDRTDEFDARITKIETSSIQLNTAVATLTKVGKVFWAVCGGAVIAIAVGVIKWAFGVVGVSP